jgi:hypothetical protein|tara:strand:- start:1832 stop:2386 length:555 start_codon:yes stop_codon:yes gene_type:complete
MEQINNLLVKNLECVFPWDNFSNDSNTQCDERNYIKLISGVIQKMGGKIGSFAPSQQPKDIRNVIFASAPHPFTYECKKSKGAFILNDTVPDTDDNYYYIFINTKNKKISIKHCSDLISRKNVSSDCIAKDKLKTLYEDTMKQIENAVIDGHISYHEYGQLFKRTVTFPNGMKSRPRPNWSIKM